MSDITDKIIRHKVLFQNFSYLTLLESFGLIFPLLTYPYLIRIFGKEIYGLVIYVQTIVSYLGIVINFGFNVSITKDISQNRTDKNKLRELFTGVYILKLLIAVLLFIIYVIVLSSLHINHKTLYYISYGLCLQEILFPIWFFQGMEKMKFITYISFFSRLLFLCCIFLFVKNESDYLLVPIINSLGGILTGIISIMTIKKTFDVYFVRVGYRFLKTLFVDSIPFFFSRLSSLIMERANFIIIGNTLGYAEVAIYDLAFKIINVLKTPFMLFAQVLYPNTAKSRNMELVKKSFYFSIILGVLFAMCLMFLSRVIVVFLGGTQMLAAVPLVRILGIYLPIVGCSTILGASALVVSNQIKAYNRSVIGSFIMYVILIIIVMITRQINIYTLSVIYIIDELFVALYRLYHVKKHKIF